MQLLTNINYYNYFRAYSTTLLKDHSIFMHSYDTLMKNKKPFHKNERVCFSKIFDLIQSTPIPKSTLDYNSYIRHIFSSNLSQAIDQICFQYHDTISKNLVFDFLRFNVCLYAQLKPLPQCYSMTIFKDLSNSYRDIDVSFSDPRYVIFSRFLVGFRYLDPFYIYPGLP